ncbi:glycosyl hydrolase [Chitinophaga cymbidii]|uniref:Glycoside hydrolase n=1 Tax=Chitinophaga cymbidii TaxID=1096750 RepID=A0A512REU9_9BACT|nr:glycosyl hydrolase [Chitinophaga cymbidii]GEP94236.1 glycoside hydrolase [Chitinophaga cymbidii]
MFKRIFFALAFIALYCPWKSNAQDFTVLRRQFAKPDRQYGTAPLWVWNTKVTRAIIDSMMADFKAQDFGGVMVHPRPGLITEYIGPEWYQLYQYTVNKGKALGLDVWIYDENSYPSGFGGGHVADQMPESYNQGQMLRMTRRSSLPQQRHSFFIAVKEENGTFRDVTDQYQQEKSKTGAYYIFEKLSYANQASMVGPPGFPYVDLMVKGVTEKFLEVTMKGYEQLLGQEFGKVIPGLFSDEPSIPVQGRGNIRWTPDLFSAFRAKWGYDLPPHLPSLFEEVGDWKKIRHNYQQTLLQLFIDRWSKPMMEYTTKHHLQWTGHYWEHGWPDPQHVPDNMAMYAWHQVPGIDMLFNQFNENSPNAQFGNIRAVKELASVANQLDRKRTLSETYGGGGWDLTFKDMKRLGDWEYVLGVNFMNQHLSFMTLTGTRKYDYPQSFSYHSPWWEHYGALNRYFARLSLTLSDGKQRNDILIIEPTTSAWMYAVYGKPSERRNEIGKDFQAFVTKLEKAQAEYDLGSENIIKDHGKVENGRFIIGQRAYSTVVIPPGMENMDKPTYGLLRKYIAQGGKVLRFEKLQRIDGVEIKEDAGLVLTLDEDVIARYFLPEDIRFDFSGGNLYHHRRMLKDGQLLFLTNADMQDAVTGNVLISGKDVLLLDAFTGNILDYPDEARQDKVALSFRIPAAGSLLLFVADKKMSGFPAYRVPEKGTPLQAPAAVVKRPQQNTFMIDFCDVRVGDTSMKDMHVTEACRSVYNRHGFEKNPWHHQVQFRDRLVARDTFANGTGYTVSYNFNIDARADFSGYKAVIEQPGLWTQIRINGKGIKPENGAWWLDRSFGVLAVGPHLEPGKNTLSLTISPMSIFAEIEPVYILGDFNLAAADHGWKIVPPQPLGFGAWNRQGLPLYGHSIAYEKTVQLPEKQDEYEIRLGQWEGTVVSAEVNGRPAGIFPPGQQTLNITPYLQKGENRIVVSVTGSLKNLLGPHHKKPPVGIATPFSWTNIKEYPPGSEYETFPYGLMEDFSIVRY